MLLRILSNASNAVYRHKGIALGIGALAIALAVKLGAPPTHYVG